ncbi:hypothetical protein [Dyella sp. 2HG41-7]|uniref:hypothetical protein n=1 Tax=Dyella sp. 2HG41-7 TaxID=2883239 RepID=UPI001F409B40|nr:hypothetical protein [Dyella sp. 2HG41-7]
MDIRETLLGEYGHRISPSPGPVEASFCSVAERFKKLKLISQMDEETVTAAFLGGVTASFPLCSLIFGSGQSSEVQCMWGHFHKSTGRSSSSDPDTEAYRGADFALVIGIDELHVRLAIFQAKKADFRFLKVTIDNVLEEDSRGEANRGERKFDVMAQEKRPVLNVHRRPPRRGKPVEEWRESQLVRLVRTGHEILFANEDVPAQSITDEGNDWEKSARDCAQGKLFFKEHTLKDLLSSLDWIHYLGYVGEDAVCVPLSAFDQAVLRRELENESFTVNDVFLDGLDREPFVDVLLNGVSGPKYEETLEPSTWDPSSKVEGWTTVRVEVVEAILPHLQKMMDVYVGDDTGTVGPRLQNRVDAAMVETVPTSPSNAKLENNLSETRRRPMPS